MALTVGTDTYITVAEADSYWSDRNNSTWSDATTADKEKALREATAFLDGQYDYIGEMTDLDSQILAWPRSGALITQGAYKGRIFDVDEVPQKLKDAQAELALNALSDNLRPVQDRGGNIKREKVDVIEIEYSDFAPSQKTFDFVNLLLRGLTKGGKNQIRLDRC